MIILPNTPLHPGRLIWNIIMEAWKIMFLSKGGFGGSMLIFQGVKEAESKLSLQTLELLISAILLPLFKEYPYTHLSAPKSQIPNQKKVSKS